MSDLLNKASLVMVPSGYKEDTVYSVVPTDGSGDLSFTRASNGTRVNSAGLVEVVPWNLLEYSEDITNGVWIKYAGTSATANTTTAPNGTTTADTISTSGLDVIRQSVTLLANSVNTYTIYVKKISYDYFGFQNLVNGVGAKSVFDLSNGTVTTQASGHTASIESVGNGWYRCIITFNCGSSSSNIFDLSADGTSTTLRTFYAWGAQLNIGSTAKPYFPTTDRLNVPRLTYQNGGGGCPSLLLEKQSTNIITYSEDFLNTAWVKADASISSNSAICPDGTQNADKIIPNTNNASHPVYQVIGTGAVSSVTLFAKPAGYNFVQIYGGNASGTGMRFSVVINLTNGTIDTIDTITSGQVTINAMINGWYKITVNNFTNFTGGSYFLATAAIPSSGLSRIGGLDIVYTGNGTDGVFVWGAQVEESSYSTSYIPTTSSSATRVADLASVPQGTIANFGSNPFCVFLDINFAKLSSTGSIALLGNRQSGNWWRIYSNGSNFRLEVNGSVGFGSEIFLNVGELTSRTKIAVNRNGNDIKIYVNGSVAFSQTSAVWSSDFTTGNSQVDFNSWNSGVYEITTTEYNEVVLFKQSLSTTELASLTTL